jgi:hypothetical protein
VYGLYAWLRRHPKLVDGLLALLVLGFGLSVYGTWARQPALILVIVALAVPIVFRRQYPAAAFAAVVTAGAVQVAAFRGPSTADVSVLILLYSLAVSRPRRASAPGLAICVLGAAVVAVRWQVSGDVTAWQVLLVTGLVSTPALLTWLAADSVRWRRGYYAALEEKAHRLERERDALSQVAAAAERARIARELHDIVAHHVSVMVVQADGAAFALENSPDKTREALGAISGTGRQAWPKCAACSACSGHHRPDPSNPSTPSSRRCREPASSVRCLSKPGRPAYRSRSARRARPRPAQPTAPTWPSTGWSRSPSPTSAGTAVPGSARRSPSGTRWTA